MNKLSTEERTAVVRALVEGNSINSTVRMTGISKPTILKLIADLGTACAKYHDDHVRGLNCARVQCDEIWSFVHCKQKNVPADKRGLFGIGDVWTWTAIDADTKLMVSYLVGLRDGGYAYEFIKDLAGRINDRFQISTDGHSAYIEAILDVCGRGEVDYGMIVKIYGAENPGAGRYSPAACTGCKKTVVTGEPEKKHISTSYVERQNLNIRMGMRRFTRLTNGFSKKVDNHAHHIAIYFMYYNFCRVHQTLRVTPAMEAKLADHVWEVEELVSLIGQ